MSESIFKIKVVTKTFDSIEYLVEDTVVWYLVEGNGSLHYTDKSGTTTVHPKGTWRKLMIKPVNINE